MRVQLECMELSLGMHGVRTERLWLRIKEKTGKGDILMGVGYRLPDQEERVDEALYKEEQPHIHRHWSLCQTSATSISAGEKT